MIPDRVELEGWKFVWELILDLYKTQVKSTISKDKVKTKY